MPALLLPSTYSMAHLAYPTRHAPDFYILFALMKLREIGEDQGLDKNFGPARSERAPTSDMGISHSLSDFNSSNRTGKSLCQA